MSFDDIECLLYIVIVCLWCKHDITDCQNVLCVEHDKCMKVCSKCEYVMHVNGKVMTLGYAYWLLSHGLFIWVW